MHADVTLFDLSEYFENVKTVIFFKLLHIKTMNKVTSACMDMLIDFIREILPEGAHVPRSWYEAKKSITELVLGHQKIDACKNDCVLFWKEYEGRENVRYVKHPDLKKVCKKKARQIIRRRGLRNECQIKSCVIFH